MNVTVVTGPPCGGKTRHIAEHRDQLDVVVDLDAIAHALGYPGRQVQFDDGHPAVAAARIARTAVTQAANASHLPGHLWLVDTKPSRVSLAIYRRTGARVITIDPGRAVCHERADRDNRPAGTHEQIDAWYGGGALGVFA